MRQTSSVRTVEAPAAHIPVAWEGDVIVCGGGSAGLMAALASAELGARTLLVERHGFLGGATTASLMFWFTTFTNGDRLVIRGMPYAFVKNSLAVTDDPLTRRWVQCDTERFKVAAVRELRKRGGGLLLHSWASEVLRAEDRVTGAILQNKSGRVAVLAKTVIDATSDGDLFPSAGVRFGVGTEDGGLLQPMSFLFQMDGVDPEAFAAFERTERHSSGAHL